MLVVAFVKRNLAGIKARDRKRIRELLKQGWTIERTGSGHWRMQHPNGGIVILSFSPKSERSRLDFERNVRQVEQGKPTSLINVYQTVPPK
jgi:predicted RNA binding protein YcfA (HicA-like mRNA interferase family)